MLSWVRWCAVIVLKQKTAYEMRISDWSSDVCSSDLSDRRQHIEKFGETHRRVDQPRDLRIGRIDQKIFVGGVCARSVADAEMRGGDRHGRRGEGRAWPAPRRPRVEARRHTQLLVGREFAAAEAAVLGHPGRVGAEIGGA